MRVLALGLLALLLSGCTQTGTPTVTAEGAADLTRGTNEFWLVWVEGSEERGSTRDACDVAFDHSIDPEGKAIRYLGAAYSWNATDVKVLIAFDVFEGTSDCPEAYSLIRGAEAHRVTEGWGSLDVQVADDGHVTAEGATIRPGEVATLEAQRNGAAIAIRIHNFGAWPQSSLHRQ